MNVNINWTAVAGATSYELNLTVAGANYTMHVQTNSHTLTAPGGAVVSVAIRAVNADGVGPWSEQVSYTLPALNPPGPVTGVTITSA